MAQETNVYRVCNTQCRRGHLHDTTLLMVRQNNVLRVNKKTDTARKDCYGASLPLDVRETVIGPRIERCQW